MLRRMYAASICGNLTVAVHILRDQSTGTLCRWYSMALEQRAIMDAAFILINGERIKGKVYSRSK